MYYFGLISLANRLIIAAWTWIGCVFLCVRWTCGSYICGVAPVGVPIRGMWTCGSYLQVCPYAGGVWTCGSYTCVPMWIVDLWVLHVCSYVEHGLVGPVCVFLCGMWTCGSSVRVPMWNGDLWVL